MPVVPAHRPNLPDATRAPLGPLVGPDPVPVERRNAWFPEHIDVLELIDRSIRGGVPATICPTGIFVPDSLIVEVETSLSSPVVQEASGQEDPGRHGLFPTTHVVIFRPSLDGLFTASENFGECVAVRGGMLLPCRLHICGRDGLFLSPDVVGLEPWHRFVLEAEDVADIYGDEPARLHDWGVRVEYATDEAAPAIETQVRFVGLPHMVRRGPKAQRHATSRNMP